MIRSIDAAASARLDDYFTLRLVKRSRAIGDVEAYRFALAVAYEDGKRFEDVRIDVGLTSRYVGEPQPVIGPRLLDFAGIAPASIRAVSLEQHLAEKIHAYTKSYGERESTRVKDLVDMVLLVDTPQLDKGLLSEAIHAVFDGRGKQAIPAVLPPPPLSWRASYPRLAAGLPVPQTSDEAHRYVANALTGALERAAQRTASGPAYFK